MSIENIEKKILEEAQLEAEKIKAEAEAKAREIALEYQTKARHVYDKITKEASIKAEGLKKSILVPCRMEAKNRLLTVKHEILDMVFAGMDSSIKEENLAKAANFIFK